MEQGLSATLEQTPLHGVYAELLGGDTTLGGAFLRGEVGARLLPNLAVFGQGGYQRETGWGAMAGVRMNF